MSNTKQASQRILERVAARSNTTVAGLSTGVSSINVTSSGFDHISKGLCRVRITASNAVNAKRSDLVSAVNKAFGNGVVAVAGSFQLINELDNSSAEYVGLITKGLHTQSVATASIPDRFSAIAKNVLMDETDERVWNLVSENNGVSVLARQVDEDLGELVAIARMSNNQNRDFLSVLVAHAGVGQYARFYNPNTGTLDHGYVCGKEASGEVVIASRTLDDLIAVDDRHIVTSTNIHRDTTEFQIHKELHGHGIKCPSYLIQGMKAQRKPQSLGLGNNVAIASATSETPLDPNSVSYTDLRDYYRQVFAYAPEYYAEFEKIIDSHGF